MTNYTMIYPIFLSASDHGDSTGSSHANRSTPTTIFPNLGGLTTSGSETWVRVCRADGAVSIVLNTGLASASSRFTGNIMTYWNSDLTEDLTQTQATYLGGAVGATSAQNYIARCQLAYMVLGKDSGGNYTQNSTYSNYFTTVNSQLSNYDAWWNSSNIFRSECFLYNCTLANQNYCVAIGSAVFVGCTFVSAYSAGYLFYGAANRHWFIDCGAISYSFASAGDETYILGTTNNTVNDGYQRSIYFHNWAFIKVVNPDGTAYSNARVYVANCNDTFN